MEATGVTTYPWGKKYVSHHMGTFPKGTYASAAKGVYTSQGFKPFVHVDGEMAFSRSYPVWKSKNPSVEHIYEYKGSLLSGNAVYSIIKSNRTTNSMGGSRRVVKAKTPKKVAKKSLRSTNRSRKVLTPVRSYW